MIPVKEVSGFADGETIDVPGTRGWCMRRGIRRGARQYCLRTAASC